VERSSVQERSHGTEPSSHERSLLFRILQRKILRDRENFFPPTPLIYTQASVPVMLAQHAGETASGQKLQDPAPRNDAATAHLSCGHCNPLRLLQPPLASSATLLQVPLAPGPRGCSGCRASAAGPRPPTHSLGAGLLRAPGGGSADSWTTILPTLRPLSSRSSAAATASKPLTIPPQNLGLSGRPLVPPSACSHKSSPERLAPP